MHNNDLLFSLANVVNGFALNYILQEVDMKLKKVCEQFISEISSSLTAPLKALLARIQVILQLASNDKLDANTLLHQQPFASAGVVLSYYF